ncbi:DUF2997 domain-containing protein [Lignipirellula cremea]|uniref:DUF2997 domain-containing protein n=1 Tax=Lignipirellula cremea TaxID=2528010 RepID=A0A518DKI6_9BACT|nr:DUF2997 domain-containing protein [Lignipirellula cremea]QDU92341.1 hypothetical protein Pla8534_00860 [Lignipirellula cremea]
MTIPRIIDVIVSPTGETRVETQGFHGATCREASAFLEQALGQRASEQLTSEFHATSSHEQRLNEGC